MAAIEYSLSPETAAPSSPSKLQRTRANLAFLVNPETAPSPASRRTRAFLRTARYTFKFIFWRLVRYAKYAAIGSLAAAVAGTAIGTAVSGVGFILAPTGILGGALVGLLWGTAKFGWRRLARKAKDGAGDARADEKSDADGVKVQEVMERREERGLRADPW
jgi:hypothetical protein